MVSHERARAEIHGGRLRFEGEGGWDALLGQGVVYIEIPDGMDVAPGVRLCESYHLDRTGGDGDEYRGFRTARFEGSVLGYSDTGSDQVERVQLELGMWHRHLPAPVTALLRQMNELSRVFVREVFARCGVDPRDVATITGGMETDEALQYCIFNNFDSRKQSADGFTPHKDSGFVQLMCIREPGLELWEEGRWVAVDPRPGHLIAITGHALEVLTARMKVRAAAPYHRVRTIEPRRLERLDRTSFGVYIGPRFDQDLYQYDDRGRLVALQSFMSFQREKAIEMGYEFSSVHAGITGAGESSAEVVR
jgi:hypothetical protein